MDLELDNVLSLTSLKNHRDKYFHKDIGFSTWKELLNFVSNKYFKGQFFSWNNCFQDFLDFYKINPYLPLKTYYKDFSSLSEGTIRG